jgi:hypothetical protein
MEFFMKNNIDYCPLFTLLACYGPPQVFTVSHHFNIIEVIEAESQAVLSTPTEHDFQDELIKWQKHWEQWICVEGEYFKGVCSQ